MDTGLSRHHTEDPNLTFLGKPMTESSHLVYSQESSTKMRARRDIGQTDDRTWLALTVRLAPEVGLRSHPSFQVSGVYWLQSDWLPFPELPPCWLDGCPIIPRIP